MIRPCSCRLEWMQLDDDQAAESATHAPMQISLTDPYLWTLADPDSLVFELDEAPGWFASMLWIELDGKQRRADMPTRLSDEMWMHTMLLWDRHRERWYVGKIAVREVPGPLIITCSLTILEQEEYDAAFTTLAGNEVCRVRGALPSVLTTGCLRLRLLESPCLQKYRKSRNQEIRLLLADSIAEPTYDTVLWDKGAPGTHKAGQEIAR